jgi:hypothetical protein
LEYRAKVWADPYEVSSEEQRENPYGLILRNAESYSPGRGENADISALLLYIVLQASSAEGGRSRSP